MKNIIKNPVSIQCNGLESPCCSSTMLPWFHRVLNSPTDDYIEARVCADESTSNEDIPIDLINVFVKYRIICSVRLWRGFKTVSFFVFYTICILQ